MPATKAIVKSADMAEEQQQSAVDLAAEALAKHGLEKDIAAFIKKEFDKQFGPTWHCIVGKNFGRKILPNPSHQTPVQIHQNLLKHFDMDEEGVRIATQTAAELMESETSLVTLAETLKKKFDELYGPRWHCVVGKPFAR
ncbi:hypothetical protein AAHC03_013742 [Spirometra sp. Aus1]